MIPSGNVLNLHNYTNAILKPSLKDYIKKKQFWLLYRNQQPSQKFSIKIKI